MSHLADAMAWTDLDSVEPMPSLPKVCVIGAGASGITAVKALHENGFEVDCYEKSDAVGGNWVWGNKNGMTSSYRSLHINTSRERMEYSDFPMEAERRRMFKRYVASKRHTMQVDYDDYIVALDKERRTGAERARRRGNVLPVAPLASTALAA